MVAWRIIQYAILAGLMASVCVSQSVHTGKTSELNLRRQALRIVLPTYPSVAVRGHKTGVAVAKIYVGADGTVSGSELLESPTPSIADAVSRAVAQWQFKPFVWSDGKSVVVSSVLTFYFEFRNGKPVVLNPDEAGYVGKWPNTSRGETRH
jgi:TonB family protein